MMYCKAVLMVFKAFSGPLMECVEKDVRLINKKNEVRSMVGHYNLICFTEPPAPVLRVEVNGDLTTIPEPPSLARDPGIDMDILVAAQNRYGLANARRQG